jgi:tetratricopeptide (TPR) repeat protein
MKRLQPTVSLGSLVIVIALGWPSSVAAQVPGPPPLPKQPDPVKEPAKDPVKDPVKDPAKDPAKDPTPTGPPKAVEQTKPTFSKAQIARVEAAQKEAAKLAKAGDWWSAAELLEQAFIVMPDPELAFKVGEAAQRAKDCPRAQIYYDSFLESAELAPAAMVQAAQKGVNELRTFDCPARTTSDDAALAETLSKRALSLTNEQDWLGAALGYARAYQLAPTRPLLAYEVGVASWKAHECGDAVSYFYHFVATADPRVHAKELKQSGKYIDDSEAGKCQPWTADTKAEQARGLYDQGQTREFAHDYLGAAGKYARAFELLPGNSALAFRAAENLWTAHHCAEAEVHYRAFVAQATGGGDSKDRAKSESILARIDTHGCPAALWNTSVNAAQPDTSGDSGPGPDTHDGVDGGPPPVGGGGGGSVACSVRGPDADRGGFGAGVTGLGLLLLSLVRRRRGST